MKLDVKRILVGISLGADTTPELGVTELDRGALAHALRIAKEVGATLRLHHSIDWVGFDPVAAVPELADAAIERANRLLQQLVAECAAAGVTATGAASIGPAWSELLSAAEGWGADLIVIGPRAHSTDLLGHLTYGSTAQKLARNAHCSVWVVHPSATGWPTRAAVMVDLKDYSVEMVELGNFLRERFGIATDLVHCVDFPADIALQRLPNAGDAIRAYHREILVDAMKHIETLLGDSRPNWHIDVSDQWVTHVTEKLTTDRRVDLFVIAGTKKPGIAGAILGSTAAKLVRRAHGSTLVARGGAWVSPS
ncbi:MAG: universal stress protein [Myxococcales bacterium]|nr:universal stress protein [Myxococcales bacterium]MCB9530236.1 universal stress protein [Myxococcales bacterium]MCB9533749.1 universal stress protein [Myxococcales bacterium]